MKIKNILLAGILLLTFFSANIFAQEDVQIGKSLNPNNRYNGGLYDYSNPEGINIKVQVWGYVKYPGQYIIPASSGVNDLLSLAGGPTSDANIDELKLFRVNPDSSQKIIKFNYSNLLWNDNTLNRRLNIPKLRAGDILLVPGSPKWYAKDYVGVVLTIVSTLASIATLLVYIYKK